MLERKIKIALFLGAGWSKTWGLPLASEIMDFSKLVVESFPGKWQRKELAKVRSMWEDMAPDHQGNVDDFGRRLRGTKEFSLFTSFIALRLSAQHWHTGTARETKWATGDHIRMMRQIPSEYSNFLKIFKRFDLLGIVTTNYDIVVEKLIGPNASGRLGGFNYGVKGEELFGSHSVSSQWSYKPRPISGKTPLLKLNGSLNWAINSDGKLVKHVDCRPSRGRRYDVAIFPPATGEVIQHLEPVWIQAQSILHEAHTWIFCGYSLPEYDQNVRSLFIRALGNVRQIMVCDPKAEQVVCSRLMTLLGDHVDAIKILTGPELGKGFVKDQAGKISRSIIQGKA